MGAARYLSKVDRFYLLAVAMRRHDMRHSWIYSRCREVERAPDGYLDLWGREHYKSTVITFGGIIQEVLNDPEITIGIFSHTKPIAKAFMAQIKYELEGNDLLKSAFPDVLWANPVKQAPIWSLDSGLVMKRESNPKEATIEAHGLVDGQPTSKHFRLMVYDDVVTRESVGTPEQIAKTTAAWELSDNLGTVGGRKWHVGTRYSYADTYESMIKRGSVTPRIHPATHDGTIGGNPVLLSKEEWERRVRDQGEATISCQMLQNPLAGQQRMFDITDLRTYEIRPNTLNAYLLIDPARSKKKDSAKTAMVVLGMDAQGNKYLLDGYNHKMDLQERFERMQELYRKWMQQPGIQSVKCGYEKFGAQADMDYFKERMRIQKWSFQIEELEWPRDGDGSKVDRVQRLGPDFRGHKFFLPYATDAKNLTSAQQRMLDQGHGYRISRPVKRKDGEGNIYDVSEDFKIQAHFFPFGGLKDVVDAASRIYDLNPTPPIMIDERSLEPEYT